jgi:uncharacterized protein (TIGR02246 family)
MSRPSRPPLEEEMHLAIEAAEERYLAAFNRADVDELAAIYAEEAMLLPDGEPVVAGRPAIRGWLQTQLARFEARQTLANDEVVGFGDWAWLHGHWTLELTPRAGGPTRKICGKHLVIWRREADGRWLAWRDIWNSDTPVRP